ncbi:1-acyl-sn-glycerol-3-phosphate acyltransferase [Lentilactobacillus sp. Marseille-Q4993]|uniref:lysophospholipid acyltransferase family protein n=1 Tax=Lentilactobacillus sp. Marseille-Q4993 TaxID=3039492 RepID=UPI0024BD03E0|nr:1-acyl-sn-glycerol-3-phosphate acyltransferase [Lentilactobacillus sp. Marseille-Q4993]
MLYSFLRVIVRGLLFIFNGHSNYLNKSRLPKGNYILVGPHRTWYDPILYALAASPKKFSFMAKKELFKNPILKYILDHAYAFPVDRQNPGPSAIKTPVKNLRKTDLSLIMFPSGTRHSSELKAGAAFIAQLSGKPLVPTVYQGPLKFSELLSRKPYTIAFGDPIYIDRKTKLTDKEQKILEAKLQDAFNALDDEIDPNFKYVDVSKNKK